MCFLASVHSQTWLEANTMHKFGLAPIGMPYNFDMVLNGSFVTMVHVTA
jgi:hypothetical protein